MAGIGLIQRSFYGGVLILAILAVRAALLYKLPKRTFPILWGVALVRLLLPFSFSSIFSVYSLLQPKAEPVVPEHVIYGTGESVAAVGSPADWTAVTNMAFSEPALSAAGENRFPVLLAVWGIGAALCAVFFIRAYLRCVRDFRIAVPVEDDRIQSWLARHRARQLISVRQSDKITAPLTYGILRPVILVPKRLIQEDNPELEYVLQHEYVHIRHRDTALKLAMVTALCIHWFNPLVWVMCWLLNLDIELACDEGVLLQFGEQAKAGYAMALIGMEERKRSLLPLYNGFSKNATEERIVLIMKYKKMTRVTGIAALLLVVSVALVFATSARTSKAAGNDDAGKLSSNEAGTGMTGVPGTDMTDMAENDMTDVPESGMANIPTEFPNDSMAYGDTSPEGITSGGNPPEELPHATASEPTDKQQETGTADVLYTLSYMQEGILTETPANLYNGSSYRILIPAEGWLLYAPDAWMWTANEQVQFWVADCSGNTWEQEMSRLEGDGYSQTEKSGLLMKESDGRIFFAEIRSSNLSMMCVNYTYPSDSEYIEGFDAVMRAISASFFIVPAETDSDLSEDGKQVLQLTLAFWEAYLAGNTEAVNQYLSADYDFDIDVFPDGIDGHVADEATLQAVKGLEACDKTAGAVFEIWLEFCPAAGADYLESLTLEVIRDSDGWKVLSYGLEM